VGQAYAETLCVGSCTLAAVIPALVPRVGLYLCRSGSLPFLRWVVGHIAVGCGLWDFCVYVVGLWLCGGGFPSAGPCVLGAITALLTSYQHAEDLEVRPAVIRCRLVADYVWRIRAQVPIVFLWDS